MSNLLGPRHLEPPRSYIKALGDRVGDSLVEERADLAALHNCSNAGIVIAALLAFFQKPTIVQRGYIEEAEHWTGKQLFTDGYTPEQRREDAKLLRRLMEAQRAQDELAEQMRQARQPATGAASSQKTTRPTDNRLEAWLASRYGAEAESVLATLH